MTTSQVPKAARTSRRSRFRHALLALFLSTGVVSCDSSSQDDFAYAPPAASSAAVAPTAQINYLPQWDRAAQLAIIAGPPRPTVISRALFVFSSSAYDAWAVYDAVATPSVLDESLRRPQAEQTNSNKNAAVSYASYHVLSRLFPAYENDHGAFLALLSQQGYDTGSAALESSDLTTPAGIGRAAALAVLDDRADDGANTANNYAEVTSERYPVAYAAVNSDDPSLPNSPGGVDFDPACWVPLRVPLATVFDPTNPNSAIVDNSDPQSYRVQGFLTPHWGNVRPFSMTDGAEFRPPGPPRPGSLAQYTDGAGQTMVENDAYNAQVDEVFHLTANLTEEQKCQTEYWADGPESTTPPGHWNQIALEIARKHRFGIDDTVKLLFATNGAVFDAGISCWEAKRHYDYIRPISAIRNRYAGQIVPTWGGPGQGTVMKPASEWIPFQGRLFVTPAFPDFTSGHSTFSGAASQVIRTYVGSDEFYDGVSRGDNDYDGDGERDLVGEYTFRPRSMKIDPSLPAKADVMRWATLTEAADQAGYSRRLGGIHYQDADLRARTAGKQIGTRALERASTLWNGGE